MTDPLRDYIQQLVTETVRAELARQAPAAGAPDRLYSIAESCAAMGVKRSRLYVELDAGRLRSLHSGRRRLIPGEAITAWIAERQADR